MAILTSILAVFKSIGSWIVNAVNDMIPIFWTAGSGSEAGSLTLLGVLCVAGLGFSVIFLIVGLIQRFFHFAG